MKTNTFKSVGIMIVIILSLMSVNAKDCSEDQYIPLSYPDDYKGNERTADDPINTGLIWIPKEACGKEVDLLITLHGHRSLKNSGDSIYLTPPTGTFSSNYPGQQTTQKEFDKIVRQYIDSGKSRPLIIAAPMHDRGPDKDVFTTDAYDINIHINKIKEKLAQTGTTIKTVSITGHSNANCAGGLARAVHQLNGYPLYFIGSIDGTCKTNEYVSSLISDVKSKGSILFHIHQGAYNGDKASAQKIKEVGGETDPNTMNKEKYNSFWKSTDNHFYTYELIPQTDPDEEKSNVDYTHEIIPQEMLREILPRFFPAGEAVTSTQPSAISKGQTGASAAGKVTSGTTLQKVSKDVPGCLNPTRCREIDQAWDQKVSPFIGIGVNQVWDHQTNGWKKYDDLYFEYKAVQNAVSSTGSTGSSTTTSSGGSSTSSSCKDPVKQKKSEESGKSTLSTVNFKHYGDLDQQTSDCKRSGYDIIILHDGGRWGGSDCSERDVPRDLISMFKLPSKQFSTHYFICTNGEIYQITSEELAGRHAGCPSKASAEDCPISYVNSRSIGIDLQRNVDTQISDDSAYSQKQYESLKLLLADISKRRNIPIDDKHVLAHFEVVKHHHNDPIGGFNWDYFGLSDHRKENGPAVMPPKVTNNDFPQEIPMQSADSSISSSDSSSDITLTPAQQIKEMPSNQENVKVYTYQSNCPQAKTQSIIYSTLSSPSISYFYIHGDDDASTMAYCTGTYKLCSRAAQQPGSLFIGLSINHRTQDKIAFKCLYDEAQNALKSLDIPMPPATILAGFSWGGRALQQIYNSNQQPLQVEKTIFFDACFNGLCQPVAKLSSSTRGQLLMYASSAEQGTQVQQNIKNILNTNPENTKGIFVPQSTHGSIPNLCFNDHINSDSCESKGQSIT